MELKVRKIYRYLGVALCVVMIAVIIYSLINKENIEFEFHPFYVISWLFFIPVVLTSCILGKVPEFITRHMDNDWISDLNETEKLFTEFNIKSISFAIVFFSMVAYSIYISL